VPIVQSDVRQRLTSLSRRSGLRLVAIVTMVVTIAVGVPPEPTLFWNALFDVGHVLVFAAITSVLMDLVGGGRANLGSRAVGWTVAATLALAAGTELVQSLEPHRDAAFLDLVRDAAGMTLALLLRGAGPSSPTRTLRRLIAAVIALAVMTPFVATAAIYVERKKAFPVVIRLDGSFWERRLLSFHRSELVPGGCELFGSPGSNPLARLSFQPATYPGFSFKEPYPDWRGFQRLVFQAAADADQSITLTLRIHDARHNDRYADRFNMALAITPGDHRIEIPLETIRRAPHGRELDLGRIRGIGVFAYQLGQPRHVCLSALRLE
jgi:hypothetical protein